MNVVSGGGVVDVKSLTNLKIADFRANLHSLFSAERMPAAFTFTNRRQSRGLEWNYYKPMTGVMERVGWSLRRDEIGGGMVGGCSSGSPAFPQLKYSRRATSLHSTVTGTKGWLLPLVYRCSGCAITRPCTSPGLTHRVAMTMSCNPTMGTPVTEGHGWGKTSPCTRGSSLHGLSCTGRHG
jgi:hypothetical protein